jgi:alpha-beta hydrolase superfamily lysophospholipase
MILFKSILTLLVIGGVLLAAPSGCKTKETSEPVTPAPAQRLVSSSLIGEYSPSQLRSRYTGINSLFQALIVNGINVYRLEYKTTNTDGKTVMASGALIVPDAATAAPLLSMQHGTIGGDSEAPSYYRSGSEAYTFGTVFASQGYIIAAPDYIGYGASKDLPHTYDQRTGLATASLDMLRAAREFMSKNNINWDKHLYLAGYSEGGYATMALQKKIEEETGDEFNLVASSCGAGAYDKTAFMKQVINERTSGVASINELYVWVLLTYDRIYGLNRPMTYYFKEPYATQVAAKGKEAVINVSLNQAFTDSFKKAINDGTDEGFLKAVRDNDIYDWKPRTPTQLYHGDADNTVLYLNSVNARDAMQKRGATNVELKPIRGGTHATSILSYITGTYSFFGKTK